MNQKLFFLIAICISFIAVNSISHAQKKYKFEKVVFGVDSIAKNSKGNNITGLIEKKTKKGKELGQYENGKKNGVYEFITPYDIVVKSETYQAGILNGPTKLFNMSGQLIESQNYSSGLLTGERNFYKAKQLIETQNYLNGKLHGKWIKWDGESTEVVNEGNYVNGLREGVFITYNPTKKTSKSEYHYEKGELKQLYTYRNNQLSAILNYKDGMLEGPITYYGTNSLNQIIPQSCYNMHKNKYCGARYQLDKEGFLERVNVVGTSFSSSCGTLEWYTNYGEELWEIYYFNNKTSIQLVEKDVAIGSCELVDGKGVIKSGPNNQQESIEITHQRGYNGFNFTRKYNNEKPKQQFHIFDGEIASWYENGQKHQVNDSVWNIQGKLIRTSNLRSEHNNSGSNWKNNCSINEYNENGSQKAEYQLVYTDPSKESFTFTLKLFFPKDTITCSGESVYQFEKPSLTKYSPAFEKTLSHNGSIYTFSFSEGNLTILQCKDTLDFNNRTGDLFIYDLRSGSGNYNGLNTSPLNLPWKKTYSIVNGDLDGFYCDEFSTGYYLNGLKTNQWVVNPEKAKEIIALEELFQKLGLDKVFVSDTDVAIISYNQGEIKEFLAVSLKISFENNDSIVISKQFNNECYKYFIVKNQLIKEIKTNGNILANETFYYPQLKSKIIKVYSSNGTLENILEFKDDKLIKSILFNEKGEEVPTIKIGNQIWTAQNFDLSHGRSGTVLTQAKTDKEWEDAYFNRKPAWCYSIYQKENGLQFGKLYNWYAMEYIAPEGWHVPSEKEWETFLKSLGGQKIDVTKILDATNSENQEFREWFLKNSIGFNARLGGTRGSYGDFEFKTYWWSSDIAEDNGAYAMNINTLRLSLENLLKGDGCFVRLIRDY
jgi:uncharacterized protein (TIGR02145 family)